LYLEGEASKFFASIVARNQAIGFQEIFHICKLEKKFEGVPLPGTAQIQLANSLQKPKESIED
jgi:hypothetical protein